MTILVVDDELNIRKVLSLCLESDGHTVVSVSNAQDALLEAGRRTFDAAFVDIRLGVSSGLDLIAPLHAQNPSTKIIVITAYASIDTAVDAMKRGAFDYLPKPFTPAQVGVVLQKAGEVRRLEMKIETLQAAMKSDGAEIDLETSNPAMQRAVGVARQVAGTDASVLIRGENGTGKGVLARVIHGWSARAAKPFVVISCPSLSAELLESELFGHARGAFTGAVKDSPGRVATAEGGTLFLDEIGDLPPSLQPKLLRFIQEREYERVGEASTRSADVRILAATNVDLEQAVREKRFREDLFYRLNVIQIALPPLRERPEDIPALAQSMLAELCSQNRRKATGFTPEALVALKNHPWPGNVRELRNAIERAVILFNVPMLGAEHLPFSAPSSAGTANVGDRVPLDQIEEQHIRRILAATATLDEAAEVLGIDAATLWRRRKKYGI